jgi:hypothetical protein
LVEHTRGIWRLTEECLPYPTNERER